MRGTFLALVIAIAIGLGQADAAERAVAVTFDDLPGPPGGLVSNDIAALRANTAKLLATFHGHAIPVVGFVNEGKLIVEGESAEGRTARTAILKMWLDEGLDLGNHTYSHHSLNGTPLAEFEADVVRGEPVTRGLLEEKGMRLRYFRHPFLQVGLDLEKRRAFEAFLKDHGYTIAPVTIDNDDYIYAAVYAEALRHGEKILATRIGTDYVRYMDSVFGFVEDVSERLTGRPIRQTLLVHANALNADFFGDVAKVLEKRGYRFVTLEAALEDEAYALPDTYVGNWGLSWLHHWELTAGRKRSPSPDPPDWIIKPYEALNR